MPLVLLWPMLVWCRLVLRLGHDFNQLVQCLINLLNCTSSKLLLWALCGRLRWRRLLTLALLHPWDPRAWNASSCSCTPLSGLRVAVALTTNWPAHATLWQVDTERPCLNWFTVSHTHFVMPPHLYHSVVYITLIIMSGWSDAGFRTLCSNPHSQTQKKPETAFHKRQFRAFSQFRPITRKQVQNDTIYLDI